MGRIQGLNDEYLTGDDLLKTGEGYVFEVTVAVIGGAVGNYIVLRDGVDGTGTPICVFTLRTVNDTIVKSWANGRKFTTGLYVDVQVAAAAQTHIDIQWK